jgi:phosphoglycerol transferase MdoB-like AlkP superfamily enzyme
MENLSEQRNATVMSTKEWALTIFLASLPIIGFVLVLVWAFDRGTDPNKKNWARGSLLLMLIYFILAMLFLFAFGGLALLASMG